MRYHDRVYGDAVIDEPVVCDLLRAPEMQRLRHIDQAGYFEPYHPGTAHSRYEHSVGVYLLLRHHGAALREQIAGLVHDMSHSAFSHAVDYVFANDTEKTQSHQDDIFEEYFMRSTLPDILARYGHDVHDIIDFAHFPLLETELPDLCADRIDYSLRDMVVYMRMAPRDACALRDALTVRDNRWVFADGASAMRYARAFRDLNARYYAGIETAVMFRRVRDYVRHGLDHCYLAQADLYTHDAAVIAKINAHLAEDTQLQRLWDRMNNSGGYVNDPHNYDAHVFCKSRIVDPLCMHDGAVVRVSDIDPTWHDVVAREITPKEYFVRFWDEK